MLVIFVIMLMVNDELQLIYEDYFNMLILHDVLVKVIIYECLVDELMLLVSVFKVFISFLMIIMAHSFVLTL